MKSKTLFKRHFRKLVSGMFATGLCLTGIAQTQVINISTGVDNAGNLLAPNSVEDTWQCKRPTSGTYFYPKTTDGSLRSTSGITYSPGWQNAPNARWLSHALYIGGGYVSAYESNTDVGTYKYRMTFNRMNCNMVSAVLHFDYIGADNSLQGLTVNGVPYSLTGSFNPSVANLNYNIASSLVIGTNTIEVTVDNQDRYTGFMAQGNITINYSSSNIVPNFTTASTYCDGDPVTFDGTSTTMTGNGAIGAHIWTVWECDQYGNINGAATEWFSPWINGAPGIYTLPTAGAGGPNLQCGKYYLVKLALGNDCQGWTQTTKVIYIGCRPEIDLRYSQSEICSGDQAGIVLGGTTDPNVSAYVFDVTAGWINVYSGSANVGIVVNPSVTTTYYVYYVNNLTGCSQGVYHTVNVYQNNPAFNLATSVSGSYYNLTATVVDNTATSQPGFGYVWFVEELDAANNSLFSINGGSCWWTFNNFPFNGFDHTVYAYSGAASLASCSTPANGKFLFNRKYRITRGTWNDYCGWTQYSQTIQIAPKPAGGGGGGGSAMPLITQVEDRNAPDLSYLKNQIASSAVEALFEQDGLTVYPNPGNGIFNIELSQAVEGYINVVDVMGKKIQNIELNGNNRYTIDLTGYAKGIYTVQLNSNGFVKAKKIVLE